MRSGQPKHRIATAVALGTLILAGANSFAAEPGDQGSPSTCIAILTPTVEGMPGSAVDSANAVRDLMASYLKGPTLKLVVLESKLPSLAAAEAKQKGCEPLLITSVQRKASSHSIRKAFGQAAGTASWNLPYGGSKASTVARAGMSAGLQTVSSLAQSTKAKDELSLEYRLQSADGKVEFGPKAERRTAKADGEDLLTPAVEHAAEAIVTRTPSK